MVDILSFLYIPNPAGLTWKFWIICFPLDIYQILGEYIEYCNVCWYSRIPSQTRPSSPTIRFFFSKVFAEKRENILWEYLRVWEQGVNHSQGDKSPKYLNIIISSFEISQIGISVGMSTLSQPLSGKWDSKISLPQYQNILDQNILDKKILSQYPNILDQNLLDQNISDQHQNICWDGNTGSQPLSVRRNSEISYQNILDQNILDQKILDQNICWDGNNGSQPLSVRWSLLLQPGFAIIHFSKSYLENHIDAH